MSISKKESLRDKEKIQAEAKKQYDAFLKEYNKVIDGLGDKQRRAVGVIHDTDKENYAQSQSIMFVRWLYTLPGDKWKIMMGEVEQDKMEDIHQYYLQFRSAQFAKWRKELENVKEEEKTMKIMKQTTTIDKD